MPILFGLGVEIHRKHGAADLVTEIARFGFCISLDEVRRFYQSVMQSNAAWQPIECREATLTHFVADNVDHNLRTLDGCDTFHGMGVIAISSFAAGHESAPTRKVKRLTHRLRAEEVC